MYPFALTNLALAPAFYLLQSGLRPLAILCVWAQTLTFLPGISNKGLPQLQEILSLCPRLEQTNGITFSLPTNLAAATHSTFLFLFCSYDPWGF